MPEDLNLQQHHYAILEPHKWVNLKHETLNTVTRIFQLLQTEGFHQFFICQLTTDIN
jgi:hypothetical protein